MKKALILAILFLIGASSVHAQTETYKNVDSTLYAYYRWCNNHIRDSVVLLKADTLFRLAGEKNDIRMQAVSQSLKADHYYFNNNLDSLKAWIPRVQAFALNNNQPTYFYFPWSRLILYYTKHGQYTLAQYELEHYLAQAEKDAYKPAMAEAYKQLGHIYRTRGLKSLAADYYGKAIDFIEKNELNKFSLPILYSELAAVLTEERRFEEAAAAIEKGKACLTLPEYIWSLKLKEMAIDAHTGKIREAKRLLEEIRGGHNGFLSKISLLENKIILYKKSNEPLRALTAIGALQKEFEEEGFNESYYYYLFADKARVYAGLGNYEAATKNLMRYAELYEQRVSDDNEKTLGEFATLLDVSRLDQEKAELQQQAQEERLQRTQLMLTALGVILLLAAAFIVVLTRMNRRLAHAKKAADASNRMKSIFIRNITHEINTPLNSIVGFAELAASEPDAGERQSYIHIIQENSGYLQKLVDDVLYIADLESSDAPPVKVPTDIDACCRECIRSITEENPQIGATIRFAPAAGETSANTSCWLLSKALTELLRNAVRFSNGKEVTLAYAVNKEERTATFTVTDKGPGIPAQEAEHIFERFVKLDTFTQGMGLGLAVCRLILSALGGTVRLDTSYTQGARFELTLPLQ